MDPNPKNMALYLKELGPDKIAEALCAAFAALEPLCKDDDAGDSADTPKAPTSIRDLAGQSAAAYADRKGGPTSW